MNKNQTNNYTTGNFDKNTDLLLRVLFLQQHNQYNINRLTDNSPGIIQGRPDNGMITSISDTVCSNVNNPLPASLA